MSVLDGEELDASLLLLARYGYADPAGPRMRGTCARVHERLGANGLLYRYLADDGLPAGEGAFGIASFWAVDCRLRQGDVAGAAAAFERLCSLASDVGLFAEEIDPATGAQLGNPRRHRPRARHLRRDPGRLLPPGRLSSGGTRPAAGGPSRSGRCCARRPWPGTRP